MYKTQILLILLLLTLGTMALAHDHLSASSKLLLFNHQSNFENRHASSPEGVIRYQAFIEVKDAESMEQLKRHGVMINSVFDGFVTAQVPSDALSDLVSLRGVGHISLGQQLHLCNDSARFLSTVEPVHAGIDLMAPLLGAGVIVGLVDTGFDFNHINFCDAKGISRVKAVYLPCDSTGTPPVIDGNPLPGSCYETPEQISQLTTDCDSASHGSHTMGTAAGSYRVNGYHGVAPQADIVACGMPEKELNDVNIANCVQYIFDYASRAGKPCVINMSIGSNEGPNDGTSFLCRAFASMSGPGRICVLSAGNDGDAPICFHYPLRGDTVTTLLRNQWGGLQREGYVSMWSDGPVVHKSRVVIINRNSGELEYASPLIAQLPEDSVFTLSSDTDLDFAQYYQGQMSIATAWEPTFNADGSQQEESMWRYHSYWTMDVTSRVAGHLIGLQYVADRETDLTGWCTKKTFFYTFGLEGITGGSPVGSISDLATCDSVISVGAYCSRRSYVDHNGVQRVLGDCNPNEIASFSSYGPDERGVNRPDVCAPGQSLLSSGNRYDVRSNRNSWLPDEVVNGVSYPYYSNQGTSMSAPVVSGAIALMLQINPRLTPSMIKEVINRTSLIDNDVMAGDRRRWGAGKLDTSAAIDDVIKNTLMRGDVNNDGEITIGDIQAIIDVMTGNGSLREASTLIRADVNHDREIQISDINCIIDILLK